MSGYYLNSWMYISKDGCPPKSYWTVLQNGILFLYTDQSRTGVDSVFPLYSVRILLPVNNNSLIIQCQVSNSLLFLYVTGTQWQEWYSCLNAAVNDWSSKRRMSTLYKNRTCSYKHISMNIQDESEPSTEYSYVTVQSVQAQDETKCHKKRVLQQLCLVPEEERTLWRELPEVIESGCLKSLQSNQIQVEERKFELIINEVVYNNELSRLMQLTRRSIFWRDLLPLFNRRSIIGSILRVKKSSDKLVKQLEKEWISEQPLSTHSEKLFTILEDCLDTSAAQTLVAYCDILDDARSMIKRAVQSNNTVMANVFSACCHIEYSLLPIQRLTSLQSVLQKIRQELPPGERYHQQYLQCEQLIVTVSGVLEHCYKVLESLHGPNYLADIDNLFDFSKKLSSLRLKRQKSIRNCLKKDNNIKIKKQLNLNKNKNEYTDDSLHCVSDRRAEVDENLLNESFSLINFNSVENLLEKESSQNKGAKARNTYLDREVYEMIEFGKEERSCEDIPQRSFESSSGMSDVNNILQRSFDEEPLYQVYTKSKDQVN